MSKSKTVIEIPAELISQIAAEQAVVFVGSGPSQGAGLSGWAGALRALIDFGAKSGVLDTKIRKQLERGVKSGKFLQVAEEVRDRLPPDQFRQALVEIFRPASIKPAAVHQTLVQIPFRSIVTTNYDPLIETAFAAEHKRLVPVYTQQQPPELSAALRGDHFHVLKIHGDINRVETIILGTKDYRAAIYGLGAYRTFMTALFTTRTVLFLGYGLNDPDLQTVLEQLRHDFREHTRTHYAFMSSKEVSELDRLALLRDLGIQVIPYRPSSPTHPEVGLFLADLLLQVGKARLASTPAVHFEEGQQQLIDEVRKTEQEQTNLSAEEYIKHLHVVCTKLWEMGSHRTAWTTLIGPFTRGYTSLPTRDRFEIGSHLAEMLIEDGVPDRALQTLSATKLPEVVSSVGDSALRFRFLKLWAQALLYSGEHEKAIAAMEDAIATAPNSTEQTRLRAQICETRLLAGEWRGSAK
jgi:hypothetical protein